MQYTELLIRYARANEINQLVVNNDVNILKIEKFLVKLKLFEFLTFLLTIIFHFYDFNIHLQNKNNRYSVLFVHVY